MEQHRYISVETDQSGCNEINLIPGATEALQ